MCDKKGAMIPCRRRLLLIRYSVNTVHLKVIESVQLISGAGRK